MHRLHITHITREILYRRPFKTSIQIFTCSTRIKHTSDPQRLVATSHQSKEFLKMYGKFDARPKWLRVRYHFLRTSALVQRPHQPLIPHSTNNGRVISTKNRHKRRELEHLRASVQGTPFQVTIDISDVMRDLTSLQSTPATQNTGSRL